MRLTFADLLALIGRSIAAPREAAHTILSLGLPRSALWMALAVVIAVSVILGEIPAQLAPAAPEGTPAPIALPPLLVAAALFAFTAAYALLLSELGRRFGGTGRFDEALALVVFLQFALAVAEILQIVLLLLAPPLAAAFFLGVFVIAIWVNVQFVDVLHGFGSPLKSILLMLGVSALMGIALAAVLAFAGVGVTVT